MKKYINKISRDVLLKILFISYCLLPILELDYLIYDILNQYGLPLPSTIFHYIWFPVLIILAFLIMEKTPKKVFIFTCCIGAVYLGFFIMHHLAVKDLFDTLYLTNRFVYSLAHELSYYVTLLIPLFFIYCIVKLKPSRQWMDYLVIVLCLCISLPIFICNIFEVGLSTYVGTVQANFFKWFSGIYDIYHPREVCSKFYFPEGNTIGILMFALYPLLLRIFIQLKDKLKKCLVLILVIIHGLAMLMIGTRVSTYGAVLSIGIMILIYFFLIFIKKEKLCIRTLVALCILCGCFIYILPYTPAVVNQQLATEIQTIGADVDISKKDEVNNGANDLIPGTAEYNYYYIHIFLDQELYKYFTFPDVYYTWIYPYEYDAKFWVDLAWEVPFNERADGRDFERLFYEYKWESLDGVEKLFGFSYSMFMNGSLNLEQDFIVQKFQYGYIGFILLSCPWICILLGIIVKAITKLKEACNMDVLVYGVSTCAMYLAGYMSGHVMDEYLTSLFLALLLGMLINHLFTKTNTCSSLNEDKAAQ